MPRIDTLHQLIADLEKRNAVIGSMELAKTPDCRLSARRFEHDSLPGATGYLLNTALGSQDLDLRLQKDGTDLLTPNMPSCYDLHRKDSTKSGILPLRFSEQPRSDVTI